MMNGQRIIRINHNLNIPNKDIYVFVDTPELCQLMSEYSNKNSNDFGILRTMKDSDLNTIKQI